MSGPVADEGVDDGPVMGALLYALYPDIPGVALPAAATPAGAATVVTTRTGPAIRAPIVPIERMTGVRMFRRMRMFCLHAFAEVSVQTLVRRPGTGGFTRSIACC